MEVGTRKEKFHILLIRFSSLGDIVLSSSVPAMLKHRWGDQVHLSYLTANAFCSLLSGHPHLDEVHGIDRHRGPRGPLQLKEKVEAIHRHRRIDLILDLHGTLRSLLIRLMFPSIPRLVVDKRTLERSLLTYLKIDILSRQGRSLGEWDRERKKGWGELLLQRNILDWAALFGWDLSEQGLRPLKNFIQQGTIHPNRTSGQLSSCSITYGEGRPPWSKWGQPERARHSYVCIVPSASFPEKRWPVEKFKKLISLLLEQEGLKDLSFLILAGPEDGFCDQFNELVPSSQGRLVNLQGKTDLVESTLLLKESLFCVGNDTGLPHLAEAVGTPAIFILGPTGEEFGFYPHLAPSRVVSLSLWCRPCTTNGKGNCIRSERFCLNLIHEETVLREMLDLASIMREKAGG